MERITTWAFRNKAAVIVCVVLVLVLGLVSYLTLPKELLPEADQKSVMITAFGQGYDAIAMADEVATPIEQAVATVKGKTEVDSTSGDGYSQVTVYFDANTDMKNAKAEVASALDSVQFPEGVQKPFVTQLNTSAIPVADVAITFHHAITQKDIDTVKDEIVPRFQDIKGVANAGVFGEEDTQVVIHLNQAKMNQFHLPLQAVMGILQGKNLTASVSEDTIDGESSTIQVVGKIDSLNQLKSLYVVPGVKLSDIATVDVQRPGHTVTHVDGKDAVLIFIQKMGSANAVSIAKDARDIAAEISKDFGPAIHAWVPFATADAVLNGVNSMMREVLTGALFATIVIFLFLRNLRMTLVTVVSIPLSLGLTLFLLSESGVTLNVLTLGAVAVAVGRLVDDSIVVIENAYRKSQLQGANRDTVIEAVKEVGAAITSSTLTTIAVFLPIGLVEGGLRQLLFPFALTIVYSLLSSLVVALTVVPLMSAGLLKRARLREHRKPVRYMKMLTWMLNHKWVPVLFAILIFAGSIGAYIALPKAQVDTSDSTDIVVSLKYPSTTPFERVKEQAIRLEDYVVRQPETKDTLMVLGNSDTAAKTYGGVQSPTEAQFDVIMKEGVNANDFMKRVALQKPNYPDAELSVYASSGADFGEGNVVNIDLTGQHTQDLLTAAGQVVNAVKGVDGVQKVTTNQQDVKPTYVVTVNPSVANAQDVAMQLRALLNQVPIGTMKLDGHDTAVTIDKLNNPEKSSDLDHMLIATKTGLVPLGKIATIHKTNNPSTVLRKDGKEYIRVAIQVDPKKLSDVQKQVELKLQKVKFPSGVSRITGGAIAQMTSDVQDLAKTMAVAIGIVYLIMVLTFKTLRAPLAILFTLPLAAVGAILGLMISGTPADQTSYIGMLILIGIVVTNAIVLLDRVRHNEAHMSIRDALVEAAATRVRPILMTAVATICAMLPLLITRNEMGSIVSKSMAVVVIGGLAVATLLTLIIIPVVYELLHFRKAKKQRKAQAARIASIAQAN
jgi:multidrug efflux pump subunit AcrB